MEVADRVEAPRDDGFQSLPNMGKTVKGMTEYRSGHFDAAAGWLRNGMRIEDPPLQIQALAFLAMAEFKRGHKSEAEAALKTGGGLLERYGPMDGLLDDRFDDWLAALHVQREAAALLGRPVPQFPTKSR
jgi:hypothetical protein